MLYDNDKLVEAWIEGRADEIADQYTPDELDRIGRQHIWEQAAREVTEIMLNDGLMEVAA